MKQKFTIHIVNHPKKVGVITGLSKLCLFSWKHVICFNWCLIKTISALYTHLILQFHLTLQSCVDCVKLADILLCFLWNPFSKVLRGLDYWSFPQTMLVGEDKPTLASDVRILHLRLRRIRKRRQIIDPIHKGMSLILSYTNMNKMNSLHHAKELSKISN